jgi:hypothetical protein
MSTFWQRVLRKPNGHDAELNALKEEFSASQQRAREAARSLARSAETVIRHKKESDFAEDIASFRKRGAL